MEKEMTAITGLIDFGQTYFRLEGAATNLTDEELENFVVHGKQLLSLLEPLKDRSYCQRSDIQRKITQAQDYLYARKMWRTNTGDNRP